MIRRGDIFYADLSPVVGSEQGGVRPVLVIQNNVGNRHSPTVICAAITSKMNKAKLPTHIEISTRDYKIVKNSVILLEQIRTIDKQRLKEYVCQEVSANFLRFFLQTLILRGLQHFFFLIIITFSWFDTILTPIFYFWCQLIATLSSLVISLSILDISLTWLYTSIVTSMWACPIIY